MKDKKSILLVEDEASLSMIIKDALEEEDFQVITAGRVRNDPADTEGE